ncbi:MAG: M28 family peptidase [Actinomycetota bacterium]|nr:M28 family peptidase [Actinomycetota bacterium]
MRTITEYLCSDICLPRNPGKPGGAAARDFLHERLEGLNLEPVGERGYAQAIPPIGGTNLLAMIPGRSERTVLLGAHYDACGAHNPGADDNAAAVAVVLTVAEQLSERDLDRTVLIALFDSEEPPYFTTPNMGSQWFVDHPTVSLDTIDTMIALDLVGHGLGPEGLPDDVRDSVFVLGAEKSTGTAAVMDDLPSVDGIVPRRIDNHIIGSMSDYDAFMKAGVPFLFYTVGRSEHYHAPTDTPDRLDYDKMAALAAHLTDLVTALANRSDVPAFVADGFDDAATVASVRSLLDALAPYAAAAEGLQPIVSDIEQRLAINGELDAVDRQLIARLIDQLETGLR